MALEELWKENLRKILIRLAFRIEGKVNPFRFIIRGTKEIILHKIFKTTVSAEEENK